MAKCPNTLDNYLSKKTKTADGGQVTEQICVIHSEDEIENSRCEPSALKQFEVRPPQTGQDPVHTPKTSANFDIEPYQPVFSFPVTDGRKFRKEWYGIYE